MKVWQENIRQREIRDELEKKNNEIKRRKNREKENRENKRIEKRSEMWRRERTRE